jgi:serine/threonine protein kinase
LRVFGAVSQDIEEGIPSFMETRDDPFLGRTLREYRLEALLGRGLTTAVYRATSEDPQKAPGLIATFFLVPDLLSSEAQAHFQTRFEQEAEQAAALRFPSLLPLYGYGELDGYPYLLTPDVQGETLMARLKQSRRCPPSRVLFILLPIITALNYLSDQGLTFPFFNPSNVLILENGAIQLAGLSLTHLLRLKGLEASIEKDGVSVSPHLKSIAGSYLGLPEYLAPEVVKDARIDTRASIYSLGAILFEMLSGRPPFTGEQYLEIAQKHLTEPLPSLHEVAPDVPVALELVVNRALHRNPNHRFQTLTDLLNAFIHVIDVLEKRKRNLCAQPLDLLRSSSQTSALPAAAASTTKTSEPASSHQEKRPDTQDMADSSHKSPESSSRLPSQPVQMQAPHTPLPPASAPSHGKDQMQGQSTDTPPEFNGIVPLQPSQGHSTMISLHTLAHRIHRIRERLHASSKEI